MKKILFLLFLTSFIFTGCEKRDDVYLVNEDAVNTACDSCLLNRLKSAGEYGIYGEVLWPVSGTAYNAVELPTVLIYRWTNGSWVYQGSTVASACGYYTYDTGGTGTYRALISGYYYLRSYPGCSTRTDWGSHAGSGDGVVSIWSPWTVVNVRCS